MKILITVSSLPLNLNSVMIPGGAEKVAWDLAKSLAISHKVSVIAFGKEHLFKEIDNIDVYFLKLENHNLWYYLTYGRKKILRIVNKINPDVINSHMHNIITFVLRFQKAKKILTLHNSQFEFYNKTKLQKLKFHLFNKNSFNKYKISTVSVHMQNYLTNTLNKTIVYVPNGIDTSKFYINKKIKKEKTILYVGRLEEFKGVKKIIKASSKLKSYKFQFIGLGSLLNYKQSKNLEFLGRKKSSELVEYYNSSFISIFPSEYENYPLVGLEAMACGSIVLANNINGFKEYIVNEENGFLADLNDSEAIVNNINKIADFPNIEKIKENAVRKVMELDINRISDMYFNLYNK